MNDPTVTRAEAADQSDHFAEVAASLYRIADDFVALTGSGLPKPSVSLSIQLGSRDGDDALTVRAVDAVSSALLGHPGQVQLMSGGVYHYNNGDSAERAGAVDIRVLYSVSTGFAEKRHAVDKLARREAELERLRAEVAELRAAVPAGALPGDKGLGYSREADDPTPVSPARVPLHTGSIVRDSELVIDPTPTGPSLVPDAIPAHYETRGWKGEGPGSCGVECACGVGFGGFDSLAEAGELLDRHIAEPDPCYVPSGFHAPEVIAERQAACAARHPGRECTTAPDRT